MGQMLFMTFTRWYPHKDDWHRVHKSQQSDAFAFKSFQFCVDEQFNAMNCWSPKYKYNAQIF